MYPLAFVDLASDSQLDQILALYRMQGWWSGPEDRSLVQRMITGSHCFVVATDNERIIGMGRAISDGASDGYIQDVVVSPAYRRRGIGSRIVKKIITRLRRDQLDWIGLIAEDGSHAFYQNMGFSLMPGGAPMLLHDNAIQKD